MKGFHGDLAVSKHEMISANECLVLITRIVPHTTYLIRSVNMQFIHSTRVVPTPFFVASPELRQEVDRCAGCSGFPFRNAKSEARLDLA